MIDFDFVSPTKIYFGRNKEKNVGFAIKSLGFAKVLIVYGKDSIRKNCLYDRVINSLKENSISYEELSGIRANPDLSKVNEGLAIVREKQIEFILAIGGGSVIDTAKSIAASYYYRGNPFDLNLHCATVEKALPIGVVLTISASGSELSDSCVITDDNSGIKSGFNSDLVRPVFAIMNPEITFTVSKYQTGCGIVDIISHSLERYFTPGNKNEISDNLALSIIKDTIHFGYISINTPNDYEARAALMLLGSYSHNGLTNVGKNKAMPIHKIEHALSAYDHNISHGAGLSVLIPVWMKWAYKKDIYKFNKFTKYVFEKSSCFANKNAKNAGILLKKFFAEIGMPVSFKDINLGRKDVSNLLDKLFKNNEYIIGENSILPLKKEDLKLMFESLCED